jgi:hypothetical protein
MSSLNSALGSKPVDEFIGRRTPRHLIVGGPLKARPQRTWNVQPRPISARSSPSSSEDAVCDDAIGVQSRPSCRRVTHNTSNDAAAG